ncbi:MAG: outer membrane beta-barrel protein [Rhizobiales bacterium]|nr:outer membrane beta-barrel protein [Hyphomicrobiales bacterium]
MAGRFTLCTVAAVSVTALMASGAPARAGSYNDGPAPRSVYVSVFGGWSSPEEYEQTIPLPVLGNYGFGFDADDGYMLGIAVGTTVMPNLRAELEYSAGFHDADQIFVSIGGLQVPILGFSGDVTAETILVNLWYDFDLGGGISPYIGGGIGWGSVEFDSAAVLTASDDDGFAYQLGAGVRIAATPSIDVDLGYRYKTVQDLHLLIGESTGFGSDDYVSHNVFAGISIKLD